MPKRSSFSIDPEMATRAELEAEIGRLLTMMELLDRRSTQKSMFAMLTTIETARERRFGVPAPKRTMRARR